MRDYASLALRAALGITFLFSVADRFGLLGPPGTPGVSWGTFPRFAAYAGMLNWYAPHGLVPIIAWVDTGLEIFLGVALLAGLWLRRVAIIAALLLLAFALTMARSNGIGAPFAYSVFTAAAGAFMLASTSSTRWSVDDLLKGRSKAR
ncbi:MAG TPA: MauE/DoxX family redox-associated membrane protein [Candidatus Eremiobacteraceae bacterium]|nr:MauE/DoxX family redox-associated membrane protein [Candidatus Eremiobacteraceae bacterium]